MSRLQDERDRAVKLLRFAVEQLEVEHAHKEMGRLPQRRGEISWDVPLVHAGAGRTPTDTPSPD